MDAGGQGRSAKLKLCGVLSGPMVERALGGNPTVLKANVGPI